MLSPHARHPSATAPAKKVSVKAPRHPYSLVRSAATPCERSAVLDPDLDRARPLKSAARSLQHLDLARDGIRDRRNPDIRPAGSRSSAPDRGHRSACTARPRSAHILPGERDSCGHIDVEGHGPTTYLRQFVPHETKFNALVGPRTLYTTMRASVRATSCARVVTRPVDRAVTPLRNGAGPLGGAAEMTVDLRHG